MVKRNVNVNEEKTEKVESLWKTCAVYCDDLLFVKGPVSISRK